MALTRRVRIDDDAAGRLLSQALAAEASTANLSSALSLYQSAHPLISPGALRDEIASVVAEIEATLASITPSADAAPRDAAKRRRLIAAAVVCTLLLTAASGLFWFMRPGESEAPPVSAELRPDVQLPADPQPSEASGTATARGAPSGSRPTTGFYPPPAEPPPAAFPAPSMSGEWAFSEQVRVDQPSIECASTGTLELKLTEGLLDGTVTGSERCQDAQGASDTTSVKAELIGGNIVGDGMSFTTRVANDGVVTTCRYTGQLVGDSGRAIAGEVSCDARSTSAQTTLSLEGTWRARRK